MMSNIELRHLRYFTAVAEELSFGDAAKRLHITQPSLSLQIQSLEQTIGAELFVRRPNVRLTKAGEALLSRAIPILDQTDEAIKLARNVAQGKEGVLRMGIVPSVLLESSLPRAIRRFRERFPGVELQLLEMSTVNQFEALRIGRIDAGLIRQPPKNMEYAFEIVAREQLMVVLPASHPLADSSTVSLSMLADESWIMFPRSVNINLYDHLQMIFRKAGVTPKVVLEASVIQTQISLVEAGFGITVVPVGARRIQVPGVVYQAISSKESRTTIAFFWREDQATTMIQALLDEMVNSGIDEGKS
ncbi:LysR substrate-binding domain-containing protein [Natronospira sp.]|uniref:LysR family transcriptional regulator n=1 Tax=Natronospira sp. TaxID=2024970 RepID=UPI003872FBDE